MKLERILLTYKVDPQHKQGVISLLRCKETTIVIGNLFEFDAPDISNIETGKVIAV